MRNNLIVKANQLVEARYNLTLNEQKVFLYAVSRLDRDLKEFEPIVINIKEFMELVETKGKQYEEIRDVARSLRSKEVFVKIGDKEVSMGWFSKVKSERGTGNIEIYFDNDLTPYLLQLQNRFTQYQLKNILNLRNKYSVRIYELMKQREGLEKREFRLDELREILMIEPEQYSRMYDFERFVLKSTKEEINNHTDILIDYEKVKRGRKVVGIRYSIQSKESQYIEYLNHTYDIPEFKVKAGLSNEKWSSKQIMELYTIACQKTLNEDVDVFDYIRLNYLNAIQNESVRNRYGYLKKALENDYALAVGQLRVGYEVELAN